MAYVKLDLGLFDASLLTNDIALEVTFSVLESHIENPIVDIMEVTEDLMLIPHLLEFAISGKSPNASRCV